MCLHCSFAAKCTEHNGDSPMCQADASCREAESPAAERTLYTDGEPEKPNDAAGPIREFRGETR